MLEVGFLGFPLPEDQGCSINLMALEAHGGILALLPEHFRFDALGEGHDDDDVREKICTLMLLYIDFYRLYNFVVAICRLVIRRVLDRCCYYITPVRIEHY